jgi:hypothetical protein
MPTPRCLLLVSTFAAAMSLVAMIGTLSVPAI